MTLFKCFCPRLEVIILSMILLVLTLSVYRYFDFVTSFHTVTFAGKQMAATKNNSQWNSDETNESDVRMFLSILPSATGNTTKTRQHAQIDNILSRSESANDRHDTFHIAGETICSSVNDLVVVVLVHTAIGNFERRKLIRNTYMGIYQYV